MDVDLASATLKALRRILRATDTGSRKLSAATGLTPSQLLVLKDIAAHAGATPGGVAQRLEFSHAAITAIVDRLVALGLAARARSDRDKRQVLLSATDAGRARLDEAPDMLQAIFASRFSALPGWEQAMMLAATERLAAILGAEDPDAAPLLDTGPIDRPGGAGESEGAGGP